MDAQNSQHIFDGLIQTFYSQNNENARLRTRSAGGVVEFLRMQELVRAQVKPGSRVLDVGGATGVHSEWLLADGHDVVLIDPVPSQVAEAAKLDGLTAQVGDARKLEFDDDSFDAVLLFGPLYHLAARDDRLTALREAVRVTKSGGVVCAQAVNRWSAHSDCVTGAGDQDPYPEALVALLSRGENLEPEVFPAAHFHTGKTFFEELTASGLADVHIFTVEGPGALVLETMPADRTDLVEAALLLARECTHPLMQDFAPHTFGCGRVQK